MPTVVEWTSTNRRSPAVFFCQVPGAVYDRAGEVVGGGGQLVGGDRLPARKDQVGERAAGVCADQRGRSVRCGRAVVSTWGAILRGGRRMSRCAVAASIPG